MSAPTSDQVIPPIVMLIGLFTVFIVMTIAMAPTITSNQEVDWTPSDEVDTPAYLDMFSSATNSMWDPNPLYVDGSDLVSTYPAGLGRLERLETFTNPTEANHDIWFYAIDAHFLELSNDRVEFAFRQKGGFLGLEHFRSHIVYPQDFTANYVNTTETGFSDDLLSYSATFHLRHDYYMVIGGDEGSALSLDTQIRSWNFNVTIYHVLNANASANPWTIVGQFFTFRLPGIPLWLNALMMAPIMVLVGLCAFILIRGALPA